MRNFAKLKQNAAYRANITLKIFFHWGIMFQRFLNLQFEFVKDDEVELK